MAVGQAAGGRRRGVFEVDEDAALAELEQAWADGGYHGLVLYPPLPALVRENRAFLIKAAGWAARQGIGQFIDLGAGLPVSPAVHQAARAVLPAARIAYVDIDPVVLAPPWRCWPPATG